jgi:hypothetical protein
MSQWQQFFKRSLISGCMACCVALPCRAADSLSWRQDQNRVAAEISSWELPKVLQTIASATGWQIFVEPNTHRKVSTKFKDRPPGEALSLLLGDLSFALLPQSNSPPKLFVFRTSLQEATKLIQPVETKPNPTAKPIPNELIITMKKGAKIDELAKKLGAKVIGRADRLNAYRLSFDSADAAQAAREQLKANSDVEAVDSNFQIQRPEPTESLSLSSGAPGFNLKPRATGGGPIVGLIDTAIQPQGGAMDAFMLPPLSVAGEVKPSDASPTHGTSMFETILRGLSLNDKESGVKILPVDVYGNNPSTSTFDVAYGIAQAINAGANPINLSLGSSGDSPFLHKVISDGAAQGVVFFAAAGNEPTAAPSYPAAYPEVFAVTAGTRDGSIASYANYGSFVDLAAPGTAMVQFNGQSWLVVGTSASTAFASGLAAGMVDGHKMTPDQINTALQKLLPVKR